MSVWWVKEAKPTGFYQLPLAARCKSPLDYLPTAHEGRNPPPNRGQGVKIPEVSRTSE